MNQLVVIHRSKKTSKPLTPAALELLEPFRSAAFRMETCQRELWVFRAPNSDDSVSQMRSVGVTAFSGAQAYRFLLSFSCGLESEVKGETDVFGQLKQAWSEALSLQESKVEHLIPWMNRIFEDTKEVRSRFLQNVGGASYGSLVRKLLRLEEDSEQNQGPILLVGAGQLAESVAPWLADRELVIWNRSAPRAEALVQGMRTGPRSHVKVVSGFENEECLWKEARHVVLCIPRDELRDSERLSWLSQSPQKGSRSVVHLGVLESELPADSAWAGVSNVYLLDDLFALQKKSDEFRTAQFVRAEKACDEKAALRAMGGSLSVPHGWEDLALFA
jgi:glutamyl-tRNA reductase